MAIKPNVTVPESCTDHTGIHQRVVIRVSSCNSIHGRCRVLWNKSTVIVLFWSLVAFVMTRSLIRTYFGLHGGYFKYSSKKIAEWNFVVVFCSAIALPVTGWATDIFIGRYQVIKVSLVAMWLGSTVYSLFEVLHTASCISEAMFIWLSEIAHIVESFGCIGFQSNIVQFCIDQLIDFSSGEIMSFIRVYIWTGYFGFILLDFLKCFDGLYMTLPIPVLLTLALCADILFSKLLIKEPVTHNPLKLIFQVLKYALKNKRPHLRSAFTYWEDKPYSRIDLGKAKYGGPFTTEQVEDVKTFFRIMGIIFLCTFFIGVTVMAYYVYLNPIDSYIASGTGVHTADVCLQQLTMSRLGLIVIVIGCPLFEFVCHPYVFLFRQKVSILTRTMIGMGLILLSLVIMMTMDISNELKYNINSRNCAIKLHINTGNEVYNGSLYWTAFPSVVYMCGNYIFFVSGIDFLCAQTPYAMKGLMVGFMYSSLATNTVLAFVGFVLPFSHSWKYSGVGLGCLFWFLFYSVLVASIIFVVFLMAKYHYKARLGEDHPPSLQYFAERYYDSSYNS